MTGVSIKIPNRWAEGPDHIFTGPEDDGTKHQIVLNVDESPATDNVTAYAGRSIEMLKSSHPGLEMLKDELKTLSNGLTAFEFVYTLDKRSYRKQLFLIKAGVGLNFMGNFTLRTMKTLSGDMERMAASIVVEKAPRM